MWNLKQHILFKIVAVILINAFLCLDISWAAGGNLKGLFTYLAAPIQIGDSDFAENLARVVNRLAGETTEKPNTKHAIKPKHSFWRSFGLRLKASFLFIKFFNSLFEFHVRLFAEDRYSLISAKTSILTIIAGIIAIFASGFFGFVLSEIRNGVLVFVAGVIAYFVVAFTYLCMPDFLTETIKVTLKIIKEYTPWVLRKGKNSLMDYLFALFLMDRKRTTDNTFNIKALVEILKQMEQGVSIVDILKNKDALFMQKDLVVVKEKKLFILNLNFSKWFFKKSQM
ncbi:MAG: hypothetical protein ABH952_07445 [Candidatus Omnitrophota bacterium]